MQENWNSYYIKNEEILDLINSWASADFNKKQEIQNIIINKLSYLIYAKIKLYKKEVFYNDLIQEGKIALITAMNDFDPNRGVNFFIVAGWHLSNRFRKFIRTVKNKEIQCENVEQFIKDTFQSPSDYYERVEEEFIIKRALRNLPEMDRYILVMRYGIFDSEECTLQQIGDMFSVSKQYVEQMEKRALEKLKRNIKESRRPK